MIAAKSFRCSACSDATGDYGCSPGVCGVQRRLQAGIAVSLRAGAPKIKPRPWTTDDDAKLRALYPNHRRDELASMLERSSGSVRSRCERLGLNAKARPWSDDELRILREAYAAVGDGVLDLNEVTARIDRDRTSVCGKAGQLGLTSMNRPKPETTKSASREGMRAYIKKNGHPRGALGMKHGPETRAKISARVTAAWRDPNSSFNVQAAQRAQATSDSNLRRTLSGAGAKHMYSRCAHGKRADLDNRYFRSSWEANYARYLNLLIKSGSVVSWEYEPRVFEFTAIKRGTRAYTPDFRVVFSSGSYEWHEVKGWMDPKSATRLARMAKYYPQEKIVIIGAEWFRVAKRQGLPQMIQGWEFYKSGRPAPVAA